MLKIGLLTCLSLTGAAVGMLPVASAAECWANVGGENGVTVHCWSNGPGTCAAAAYTSPSGGTGAACMVVDYPQDS